jgi:hypothetical protein
MMRPDSGTAAGRTEPHGDPAGEAPPARRTPARAGGAARGGGARSGAALVVRRAWPAVVGLGLGLLALGPGLGRGFLLSYDMVAVPRQPFGAAMFGLSGGPARAVPSDVALAVLSRVIPADLAQKTLLLAIFTVACAGAAALLPREPWFARLAAGVFYTWNPFVAERLIIGQWALLLGYAGLPWVLRAALALGPGPSWRGAGRLALALLPAAIGGFAAMTISALVALPAAAFGAARPAARRPPPAVNEVPLLQIEVKQRHFVASGLGPATARRLRAGAIALAIIGVASLPWLIPSLLRPVYADPAGVAAFAARADTPFGAAGSLLMLGGMWNARAVPAGYGGGWSVLWLAVVVTAAAGYVLLGGRRRWPGLGLAALAGLAIAALGLTGAGQDLLRAAQSLWPGFAVLRDGQQFAAPLALAEALGAGLAAAWLARRPAAQPSPADVPLVPIEQPDGTSTGTEPRRPDRDGGRARPGGGPDRAGLALAVCLVLAPVLLLPGLTWGAAGRLRPAQYPAGWLAAARLIDSSPAAGTVLVLPWAGYRSPAWNGGRTILDPWPRLVSRPVIWNDGPQVGPLRLRPDDPAARALDGVIRGGGPLTSALRAAGVRFVVSDGGGGVAVRLPGAARVTVSPGLTVYLLTGSNGK